MRIRSQAAPGQLALGLLDDADAVRDTLVAHLRVEQRRARFIRELGMQHGAARIDLAVVDDSLDGYEIKSCRDDLRRLGRQTQAYSLVFDRLTLVSTEQHLEAAARAVPAWWGLTLVDVATSSVTAIRPADINPEPDPASLARLLWRVELEGILRERSGSDPRGVNAALRKRLVDELTSDELRTVVRRSLADRQGWPVADWCA